MRIYSICCLIAQCIHQPKKKTDYLEKNLKMTKLQNKIILVNHFTYYGEQETSHTEQKYSKYFAKYITYICIK